MEVPHGSYDHIMTTEPYYFYFNLKYAKNTKIGTGMTNELYTKTYHRFYLRKMEAKLGFWYLTFVLVT